MTKKDITHSNWVVASPRHRPGTLPGHVTLGALTKSKALVGMVCLVLGEETAQAQRSAYGVTLILEWGHCHDMVLYKALLYSGVFLGFLSETWTQGKMLP